MKKIILLSVIIFLTGNIIAKDKFRASFELNGKKYKCELIYERSELIPTYKLNIRAIDLKTNVIKKTSLIIKKQEYARDLKTNIETWERFLKRRSSHRVPREITFHIVDEDKSYAVFIFERGILKEYFLNEELCPVKDRDTNIYIYQNESIIFAVVRQFLKGTTCLPNETVITKLN